MSQQGGAYREQGTGDWVIPDGATVRVESGGTLQIDSGASVSDSSISGNTAVGADVLVIPVTAAHVSKTTGADGEALTLADGTPGQILTITLVVDGGGDGTLTPATVTGFATIVFADAGDTATLRYVDDTVGWVLVGASGVAAPPAITV